MIAKAAILAEMVVGGVVHSHTAPMQRPVWLKKIEPFTEIDGQGIRLQETIVGQMPWVMFEKQ